MGAVPIVALCALLVARPASAEEVVSIGSDTMEELMQTWAEGLREQRPALHFRIESLGSATAPEPLGRGESQLGPMSRRMTRGEERRFREATGHRPLGILVALDAIAVVVHRDNGLRGLTLRQLDGIFSATQECGGRPIRRWGALVFGALGSQEIRPVGRDELSGTGAIFREAALCGGRFAAGLRRLPNSDAVISAVASDPAAIGFTGLGRRSPGVHVVAVARGEDDPYVPYLVERHADDPDPRKRYANVTSGRYPLSRGLWIYVDKAPGEALAPGPEAVLEVVLSDAGQGIVEQAGFVPLGARALRDERQKLSAGYSPSWWSDWRSSRGGQP